MNQFLNKLERKFGRYAITDLTKYVVVLYCVGAALGLISPMLYYSFLSLDFDAILHGQVWRLFTYLLEPYGISSGMGFFVSIIFFAFKVNLIFLFGRSLERAWGTFRYNMYFFSGFLLNIVAALILYLSPLHASVYYAGFEYIYMAMFFAFAVLNPDMEFLIYFVIPIKVKWLAILDAVYLIYQIVSNTAYGIKYFMAGDLFTAGACISIGAAIIVAMLNFWVFFAASRDYRRISPKEIHRKREFKRKMHQAQSRNAQGTRHRCAICGRTELDNPDLDFRYCSKCDGNYEYCSDHLFTHQHVRK